VSVGDLGALATNYGTSLAAGSDFATSMTLASPTALLAEGHVSAVPEPSSLMWIGAGGLLAARRRRRR
jgi:hypothetical protein